MDEKPIVIYDGSCGMCARYIKLFKRLDWFSVFSFTPYQEDALYEAFPQLDRKQCEEAMHLVFPNGKFFAGSDAFSHIFLRLPLLSLLGLLMCIPPIPWISRRMYKVIAKNRYRIGGHCHIDFDKDD